MNKISCLELRLCIVIIISIIIIVIDSKLHMLFAFRNYINNSIYLLYCLCNKPINVFSKISQVCIGYKRLVEENSVLRKELFLKNSELLLIDQYKQENYKLYKLLNAPIREFSHKLIAKIFFINIDLYNQKVIIDQGIHSGVYVGQPVFADTGVVGQIISVHQNSSRVLLISDRTHALPVKLKRNNMRMILTGCGSNTNLYARCPGKIDDVYINDILVTSGLDGRFPEGYPVAAISEIHINSEEDFAVIYARPIVDFENLRYAILIWE